MRWGRESGDTEAFVHVQGSQSRGLPCQVTQSRKVVSECLVWVGPCPQCSACLCELDCVSWCMCLQKGVGLSPLSLPWKEREKAEWVIHRPHPPSLGPALARAQRGKSLGGGTWGWGWGGIKTTGAGADFAAFPCSAPREYISIPYPTFSPLWTPNSHP